MSSQDPANAKTPGISGKMFVIPFAAIVLFSGWLIMSMAFRFQAIMNQLEVTRSAWPKASQIYQQVFEAIDGPSGFAKEKTQTEIAKRKPLLQETSMFDKQSLVVRDILEIIRTDQRSKSMLSQYASHESLQDLERSEKHRSQLQSGIVGWCTVQGLRLKLPPIFQIE